MNSTSNPANAASPANSGAMPAGAAAPPATDHERQPGYRPGAPDALLGACFVVTWLLWLGVWLVPRWSHPLATAAVALALPLLAFIALNLVNLACAGLAHACQALLPPLRRWRRQQLVALVLIVATTATAVRLAWTGQPVAIAGAVLWLTALVIYGAWSLRLRSRM